MQKKKILLLFATFITTHLYTANFIEPSKQRTLYVDDLIITYKDLTPKKSKIKSAIVPFGKEGTMEVNQKQGYIFYPELNEPIYSLKPQFKRFVYTIVRHTVSPENMDHAVTLFKRLPAQTEEEKLYYTIAAQRIGEVYWQNQNLSLAKCYFKKAVNATNFTGSLFFLMLLHEIEKEYSWMAYCHERAKYHGFNTQKSNEDKLYALFADPDKARTMMQERVSKNPCELFFDPDSSQQNENSNLDIMPVFYRLYDIHE